MAVNAGEVSIALTLDDAGFLAGLTAARASLEDFAQELAALTAAPADAKLDALSIPDASARFADAGSRAGAAFDAAAAAGMRASGATPAAAAGLAQAAGAALGSADASAPGGEFALAYAAGIAGSAGSATAQAASLARSAASAARGGMGGASSIGRSFASGLALGIRAGRSGVVSAAAAVARAAAEAARSALAIHSPSRVTEELGEFFDLGFIRGVDRLTPDIERSVRSAIQVEPPAGVAYGTAERTPVVNLRGQAIDYDALADAMDRRQMVLTMDNRRLAEVQTRETARAQSMRNKSVALGYGRR